MERTLVLHNYSTFIEDSKKLWNIAPEVIKKSKTRFMAKKEINKILFFSTNFKFVVNHSTFLIDKSVLRDLCVQLESTIKSFKGKALTRDNYPVSLQAEHF